LLRTVGLTKQFGGVRAVDRFDYEVDAGQINSIIGPNGAGKSTLFNLFSGVVRPTAGQIWLDGQEITRARPHQITRLGLARTFQKIRLFRNLTALHNVVLGQHARTSTGLWGAIVRGPAVAAEERRARERALEALELVGLAARRDELARHLPYGQQRLLEIARALATEPKLMLIDEPAAGLTFDEAQRLMELIRSIRDRGVTCVIVEHNMDVVMNISDKITVLNYGEKIAEGTAQEIRADAAVIAAYLGEDETDLEEQAALDRRTDDLARPA
jgi:branched-chain amino acid transport system ATP-binding protein